MTKTLGQIAYDAAGETLDRPVGAAGDWEHLPEYGKRYWQAAASAIVEECAKMAEYTAQEMPGRTEWEIYVVNQIVEAIRSLSSTAVETETK